MAAKIKKGDTVVVLTGKDKGKTGEVIRVIPDENRAVVRGVNVAQAPPAPDGERPGRHRHQGNADPPLERRARRSRAASRPASGSSFDDDGSKVRFAKRTGDVIDG